MNATIQGIPDSKVHGTIMGPIIEAWWRIYALGNLFKMGQVIPWRRILKLSQDLSPMATPGTKSCERWIKIEWLWFKKMQKTQPLLCETYVTCHESTRKCYMHIFTEYINRPFGVSEITRQTNSVWSRCTNCVSVIISVRIARISLYFYGEWNDYPNVRGRQLQK